jgi:DNA-binding NarL/FixJ family response regulator
MCQPATEVLVVDPDRRVRAGLRTLLSAGGFVISGEASGASAARAAARGRPPDAAVIDPLLPGLSRGCELISWLATQFGTVVVALTSDPGARSAAISSGASRVLMKGCEPDAVLAALGRDPRRPGDLGDAQRSSVPRARRST